MSTFSIGGIASGLDTGAMIDQLMALERLPMRRLEQRQDDLRAQEDAWAGLATKLSGLNSALGDVAGQGSLNRDFAVNSSNTDVLGARRLDGGQPDPGATQLTVEQLATRGQVASGTFDSPDVEIGAGTFSIQVGTETIQVETTENATMRDLVDKINGLDGSARATILKTGEQSYRVVITSRDTGAANSITITQAHPGFPAGAEAFETTQDAEDAVVWYGGVRTEWSDNVIADLVPGVEVTLKEPSAGPVTVDVDRDFDGTVERVEDIVAALNAVLSTAEELGRTSPDAEQRGPLAGDMTLRSLTMRLRDVVASGFETDDGRVPASQLGIELTRDGEVTLDADRLRQALEDDFEGTVELLSRSASIDTPYATSARMGSSAAPGSYQVEVTQAATRAASASAGYSAPAADATFTVLAGSREVEVTVAAGAALADAVESINAQLADGGLGAVRAIAEGGEMRFASQSFGSAGNFELQDTANLLDASLDGSHEGLNVEGTIGGEPATGSGRRLAGTGDAAGLSLLVTAGPDDLAGGPLDLGTVEATAGLGGTLARTVSLFEGHGGVVTSSRDRISGRIGRIDNQIERFEDRLDVRRRMLVRQFTGMEQAMARLQDQGQWLQGQLAGMMQ